MNESLGLYLLRTDCPDVRFRCHHCGETHLWGEWARNEHALLVECTNPRTMQPHNWQGSHFTPRLTPPAAVIAIAESPATDSGSGLFIRCEHEPPGLVCPGMVLRYNAITAGLAAVRHQPCREEPCDCSS